MATILVDLKDSATLENLDRALHAVDGRRRTPKTGRSAPATRSHAGIKNLGLDTRRGYNEVPDFPPSLDVGTLWGAGSGL